MIVKVNKQKPKLNTVGVIKSQTQLSDWLELRRLERKAHMKKKEEGRNEERFFFPGKDPTNESYEFFIMASPNSLFSL